jgi:hypothetical protein
MSLTYQPLDHEAAFSLPYRAISFAIYERETEIPEKERDNPKVAPSNELKLKEIYHITPKGVFKQDDFYLNEEPKVDTDEILKAIRSRFTVAIYSDAAEEYQAFADDIKKNFRSDKKWAELAKQVIDRSSQFKGDPQIPNSPEFASLSQGLYTDKDNARTIADQNASGVLVTDRHVIYRSANSDQVQVGEGSLPTAIREESLDEVAGILGNRDAYYFDYRTWSKLFPITQNEITTPPEWSYLLPALRTNTGLSAKSPCLKAPTSTNFDPFDL